jgi:WD40 repeat protein
MWIETFDEYVTAIAAMPDRSGFTVATFTVATANGEIVCLQDGFDPPKSPLERGTKRFREADGFSIDALAYSTDGRYLAAAGQVGTVLVWEGERLIVTLPDMGWVDQLAWCPGRSLLAFGTGKMIRIWNAEMREFEAQLEFSNSSVLGLAWTRKGDRLLASGNQIVKCWDGQNWNAEPEVFELASTGLWVDGSIEDEFFAVGCFDRSVIISRGFSESEMMDEMWRLSGFPEKVVRVLWSIDELSLATVSGDGVVIWRRAGEDWAGELVVADEGRVNAIAWSSRGLLVAIGDRVQVLRKKEEGRRKKEERRKKKEE